MSYKDIIFQNTDLLFYLTDFLDDRSAFRLLNTNKHYNTLINKYPHRYTVKKIVSSKSKINYDYKIEKFQQDDNKPMNKFFRYLKEITFDSDFNEPIDNLPSCLKTLDFGFDSNFNQPINNLPSSLETLRLSYKFNHPIDNFPLSLSRFILEIVLTNLLIIYHHV